MATLTAPVQGHIPFSQVEDADRDALLCLAVTTARATRTGGEDVLRPSTNHIAEFNMRTKKKSEGWADFGEDLRVLADRAFPTLGADARQLLALQQYLTQLANPQVAFAVKQQHPTTVEAAVSITLELESYLLPKQRVARVKEAPVDHLGIKQDALLETMSTILDRLERLETQTSVTPRNNQPKAKEASAPVVCYKCGKEGHYARGCAAKKKLPGNGRPEAPKQCPPHTKPAYSPVRSIRVCLDSLRVSGLSFIRQLLERPLGSSHQADLQP